MNTDVPSSGAAGDWTDDGVCATAATGYVAPTGTFTVAAKPTVAASKASAATGKVATVIQSASSAKETAKKASRFFNAE